MANHHDSLPIKVRYHDPYEEIALGPACWLWDYLRRSRATGYLLPLSGGADSSSVAAIVGSMYQLVVKAVKEGDEQVTADAVRIGNYKDNEVPESAEEFAQRLLHTVYMGTEKSSEATRSRAKRLAEEVGASHLNVNIDVVVKSLLTLFDTLFPGKKLRYKVRLSFECLMTFLFRHGDVVEEVVSFLYHSSILCYSLPYSESWILTSSHCVINKLINVFTHIRLVHGEL